MRSRMLAGLCIAAAVAAVTLTTADRARATEPSAYQKGVIEVSAPAPIAFAPVVVSLGDSAQLQTQLPAAHEMIVCVVADPADNARAVADSMDTTFLPAPSLTRMSRRYESAIPPSRRRTIFVNGRPLDSLLTRHTPTARSTLSS